MFLVADLLISLTTIPETRVMCFFNHRVKV